MGGMVNMYLHVYSHVDPSHSFHAQPSLNELPPTGVSKKRPAPSDDVDVAIQAKQPRTVDIDLPYHCEPDLVAEPAQKGWCGICIFWGRRKISCLK